MSTILNIRPRTEIQRGLDGGMSPDEVADSIGRINDLSGLDVEAIRVAAQDLQHDREHGVVVLAVAR